MTKPPQNNVHPLKIADASRSIRHVFVRNLVLDANIGAYAHEKGKTQPIRINIDLSVEENLEVVDNDVGSIVCYDQIVRRVKMILGAGHIQLVETMAERIADMCLQDHRVKGARVRVEKLEIMAEAESVGVEIERFSE